MTSKSTLAKVAMGYEPAAARCKNCQHAHEDIADRMPPFDTRTWRCRKGSFTISPLAICNEHQRETAAAQAAKQGATKLASRDVDSYSHAAAQAGTHARPVFHPACDQLSPDQAGPQGR